MIDFDVVLKDLKGGLADIAKKEAKEFVSEARADGEQFLDEIKDDLQKWTKQLAEGRITKEEFQDLLGMQRDLAVMKKLTQKGLGKIRIQRIQTAMIDLIFKTIAKIV